jgi:NAD-dependent SIR2 family protein deacetylase
VSRANVKRTNDTIPEKSIKQVANLLKKAEKVWIGAGAGLSAAADPRYNYGDREHFAKHYRALLQYGFKKKLDLMGFGIVELDLQWGYYLKHVREVRFLEDPPVYPVYARLLDLVKTKDYFVITTNVDALFERNGFEADRIYTPQGDYALMQCMKPCTSQTWPTKPAIEKALPTIDPATHKITDDDAIPRCPNCDTRNVFLNVRAMKQFIETPYEQQLERYRAWLNSVRHRRTLVIDIGSGFNTPVWVRFPAEAILKENPTATLVRINLDYPQVPPEIAGRAIMFKVGAHEAISALWEQNL